MEFLTIVLDSSIRLMVPLLLATLGELISQRSGVLNVGLEGMMAAGAFAGFFAVVLGFSLPAAILIAILCGALAGGLMAVGAVWLKGNHILVGFSLFILLPGLANFILVQGSASASTPAVHEIEAFGPVASMLGYDTVAEAAELVNLGGGSLVTSVATGDPAVAAELVARIGAYNGRVLILGSENARTSTGHGAPVPHLVHGQRRVVGVDHVLGDRPGARQAALFVGHVAAGERGHHAGLAQRRRDVDPGDPGVRQRAAQDRQVQHAGQGDVFRPHRTAGDQPRVLLALARGADLAGGRFLRDRHDRSAPRHGTGCGTTSPGTGSGGRPRSGVASN